MVYVHIHSSETGSCMQACVCRERESIYIYVIVWCLFTYKNESNRHKWADQFHHTCINKHNSSPIGSHIHISDISIHPYILERKNKEDIPRRQIIDIADKHLKLAATFRGKASVHLNNHGISHLLQFPDRSSTFLLHFLHHLHCLGPSPVPLHFPFHNWCRRDSPGHRSHTYNSYHHLLLHRKQQHR